MRFEEIFLFTSLSLILLLLSFQRVFIRIVFSGKAEVIIEYFPIKLILYNFLKRTRRKKKRKFIKSTKRALFFIAPVLRTLAFLLNKSTVKIYSLDGFLPEGAEPHRIFITKELSSLLSSYIYALFYSFSKETAKDDIHKSENTSANFDIQLSTRLYNVVLSGFVFIFLSIKKKGRIKKFV